MDSGNLVDLAAYRNILTLMDDATVGRLLAWRDSLVAAANVGEDRMAFVVPPESLPGVEWLYGSRVVRSDVTEPMVALAVPKPPA
jgi:hypothetical protein